jgi:hypothetical protein
VRHPSCCLSALGTHNRFHHTHNLFDVMPEPRATFVLPRFHTTKLHHKQRRTPLHRQEGDDLELNRKRLPSTSPSTCSSKCLNHNRVARSTPPTQLDPAVSAIPTATMTSLHSRSNIREAGDANWSMMARYISIHVHDQFRMQLRVHYFWSSGNQCLVPVLYLY